MSMRRFALPLIALAALVGGVFLQSALRSPASRDLSLSALDQHQILAFAQPASPFQLPDLDNIMRHSREWGGSVRVINFWATWCRPCLNEIPVFIALQARYADQNTQFIGIAIDEADAVRAYAKKVGVNYPILIGQADAVAIARAYGNLPGVLPYTAVVDRQGKIAFTRRGELHRHEIETVLDNLL